MRKCSVCKKEKPLSEFYIYSSTKKPRRTCKQCMTEYSKQWEAKNPDRLKAIRRKRKEKKAEYAKEWYLKHKKEKGRTIAEKASTKRWNKENPEKAHVHRLTFQYIKNGIIKKPDPEICELCKRPRKLLAHHPDYKYPKQVQWICSSCHKNVHMNNNKGRNNK